MKNVCLQVMAKMFWQLLINCWLAGKGLLKQKCLTLAGTD
jgi:hypothetical protein